MAKYKYIDDEYRIRREISGESNMSQVFLCVDDNDEECAIKLFNKFDGNEDNQKLQETIFFREVEILQKISHPNIVKYKASGLDDHLGKFYIALEYIDGKNLKDALSVVSEYDDYSKLELVDQILAGVEHLHKKNIVHRDLKPSNIMLTEDGVIKIIDFGISKFSETYYSEYTVLASKTLPYCSPEQEENKEATVRSDIYSLGLICFEIFTGEKADKEKGFNTTSYDVLSANIQEMLAKMLKRDPAMRYGNVTEIRRDINIIKSKINQEKFLIIGVTKSVSGVLFQNGYITKDDVVLYMVNNQSCR